MIFVTVGAQMPFDRLVQAVDEWAGARSRSDVFAQIGSEGIPPSNIEFTRFLEAAEFKRRIREADVVISHAGMGTILSALEAGRRGHALYHYLPRDLTLWGGRLITRARPLEGNLSSD